ncbi:MAG: response regulator [Fibrobacteria bacterium]|nr:response regulator [Fibrobacteria bacterium]
MSHEPPTAALPLLEGSADTSPSPAPSIPPSPPLRHLLSPALEGFLVGVVLCAFSFVALAWYHRSALETLDTQRRASLARTAALTATFIDSDDIQVLLSEKQEGTPTWNRVFKPLHNVIQRSEDVRYVYIMYLDRDSIRFLLDASPWGDADQDGQEDHSPLGSSYPWAAPELWTALREGTRQVDMRLIEDPWGIFLSAYAPLKDSRGRVLGVVGIDVDAKPWIESLAALDRAWLLSLFISGVCALLAGLGAWGHRRRAVYRQETALIEEANRRRQAMDLAQDLEERVHDRTRDLQKVNGELRRALRTRETFLATANHELRTPLQSLLTSVEILEQGIHGDLNTIQRRKVATIRRCARHLLDLISQVLDLSRARSGKIELFREKLDLSSLCLDCLELVEDEARRREVILSFQSPNRSYWLYADALRLRQIVLNMLENTLRFTDPHGTVSLSMEASLDGSRTSILFTTSGPGIPEDLRGDLFRSLDDPAILAAPDQHLGLPLVGWLAALHDGTLHQETAPRGGTAFRITLPTGIDSDSRPSPEVPPHRTPKPRPSDPVILLAEDNPDIRETLCEFLEAQGCQVLLASNGNEAVQQANRQRPDLVLMDVQMPGMDGLEATRKLRENTDFSDLPIVIMTAFASGEDAERCRDAGATSYIPKPLELRRLGRILTEFLPQHTT